MSSSINELWVRSQLGKLGPYLQDLSPKYNIWKEGTQLGTIFRDRVFSDKYKYLNLEKLERWDSVTLPSKWFRSKYKPSNSDSNPMFKGSLPVILLLDKSNPCNTCLLHHEEFWKKLEISPLKLL